jgi:hypothetical protein
MRLGWNANETSARIRGVAKSAALAFLAMYMVIYLREPFSEIWNNILINLFLIVAASLTAAVATMVWAGYEPAEIPRDIWRYFAIGLWLWAAAEIVWGYLFVTRGEVSEGVADVFWVAAYVFFAYALFLQYRLLAQPNRQELWRLAGYAALALLVLYILLYRLLTTWVNVESQWSAAVNSFYPVADLFLASIAIWLIRHFRGGAFARPWLGLLAFSFTDLLYAWIETSGIYEQASVWTVVFDTTYVGAYLLLGLGILSQWAFLKYGLRSDRK